MSNYSGAATLLVPGKPDLPVHAEFTATIEHGMISWFGTLSTQQVDGALHRAIQYNQGLRVRLPDGRDAALFIRQASSNSRTAQVTGRGEPPYGTWGDD